MSTVRPTIIYLEHDLIMIPLIKQGQTVHKLQIATFWELYLYIYISVLPNKYKFQGISALLYIYSLWLKGSRLPLKGSDFQSGS